MSSFTVYRASAGSGKTFNLVVEYLGLCLVNNNPKTYRKILAVTFTNKAANELKEKVLSMLWELGTQVENEKTDTMRKLLFEKIKVENLTLSERAMRTYTDILHNYSRFSISTIDKFVTKLVRRFARELQLSNDFEIQVDDKQFLQNAATNIISQAGVDENLTKSLVRWQASELDHSKNANLDGSIKTFIKELLSEKGDQNKNLLPENNDELWAVHARIDQIINQFDQELKPLILKGYEIVSAIDNSLKIQQTRSPLNFFSKVIKGEFQNFGEEYNNALLFFESGQYFKTPHPQQEVIFQLFEEIKTLKESSYSKYKLATILKRSYFLQHLVKAAAIELANFTHTENKVLLSEFHKKIADIVLYEPAPFIYEILGERYDHFLIDEFQDTSIQQWRNFLPLIHNSISKGKKCILVGDGKQSIYRFRNGDVEQFQNLPGLINPEENEILSDYERALTESFNLINLEKNYRSSKNIISFNNDILSSFFKEYLPKDCFNIFDDGVQLTHRDSPGFVRVRTTMDSSKDALTQFNCSSIISDLRQLNAKGHKYGSCCILIRNSKDGRAIANALTEAEIDFESDDNLKTISSFKNQFVISLIGLALNSQNHQAIASFLKNGVLLQKFEHHKAFERFIRKKHKSFEADVSVIYNDLQIGDISEMWAKDGFSHLEILFRKLGFMENADPYILSFLEESRKHLQANGYNLLELCKFWNTDGQNLSITLPEAENSVKITTIHKSKGLEYENVILPFLNWREDSHEKFLWIHPTDEFNPAKVALVKSRGLEDTVVGQVSLEESNKSKIDNCAILYVALTRARTNLFIYSSAVERQPKALCSHFFEYLRNKSSDEIFELGKLEAPEPEDNKTSITVHTVKTFHSSDFYEAQRVLFTGGDKNISLEKGNRFHLILSKINDPSDVEPTIDWAEKEGLFLSSERMEISLTINTIISKLVEKDLMGSHLTAANEIELFSSELNSFLRADRIVFKENETHVIDYKTGSFVDSYQSQVNQYKEVLSQAGYPNPKAIILMIEEAECIML